MDQKLITIEEWLARNSHPIPGWGVPNPEHDPKQYAAWCRREGVINAYEEGEG